MSVFIFLIFCKDYGIYAQVRQPAITQQVRLFGKHKQENLQIRNKPKPGLGCIWFDTTNTFIDAWDKDNKKAGRFIFHIFRLIAITTYN